MVSKVKRECETGFGAVSGTWELSTSMSGFSGTGYLVNRSNTKGDSVQWALAEYLPAGSYRALLRALAAPEAGALSFNIENAKPVKVDLYSTSRAWIESELFFDCPAPWHIITLLVDEKNPKSTGNYTRVDRFLIDQVHPLQHWAPVIIPSIEIIIGVAMIKFIK